MTHTGFTSAQIKRANAKKRIFRTLAALLVLTLMLALSGCDLLKDRSATALTIEDAQQIDIDDLVKYESLQELDIRKAIVSVDEYLALQSALPSCRIIWSVPIADQRFDNQVTQLALPASTDAAALELIQYFPNLTTVDALACTCYDALMSKSLERKDIAFTWQLEISGVTVKNTDTALDLSGKTLDTEALVNNLYVLPALTAVDLTDTNIDAELGAALEARYPNIAFLRSIDVFGVSVNTDVTEVDLTSAVITDEATLPDMLASLKYLTSCDLTGQTISFATMDALRQRYPQVAFAFTFDLFGQQFTPETTEINLQGQTFTSAEEVAEGLAHLPALTSCDLCGTGLTNEQMVQLQTQFPAVKFVWYVQIGAWQVRTDIEAFTTQNRKEFPNQAATFTKTGNTKLTDEDVAGLAYCTDLTYLDLTNNKITDLSFVKNLLKLRLLCVGNNKITDLSPLSSLTELEFLEIYANAAPDVTPLTGLTKLTHLNCARVGLSDLTTLGTMKQLKMLWMMNNKAITKEGLEALTAALPECTINVRGTNPLSLDWHVNDLYYAFEVLSGLVKPDPTPTPEPSATVDPSASPDASVTPLPTPNPTAAG